VKSDSAKNNVTENDKRQNRGCLPGHGDDDGLGLRKRSVRLTIIVLDIAEKLIKSERILHSICNNRNAL